MPLQRCLAVFLIGCAWAAAAPPAGAVKIRFPREELARESVLPLFKDPKMVLDRRVTLKNRIELGLSGSYGLDEPYYFPWYATGLLAFYFAEHHGVSLMGSYFPPYASRYEETTKNIEATKSAAAGKSFHPRAAPHPLMMAFVNYQYTPYYGKISLAKRFVLNLSIYGFGGPGLMVFNDNGKTPALNIGFGQKLYLARWLAVRGDFIMYGYYGPAPAKMKELYVAPNETAPPVPSQNLKPEHKRVIFNLMANVGLIFLI